MALLLSAFTGPDLCWSLCGLSRRQPFPWKCNHWRARGHVEKLAQLQFDPHDRHTSEVHIHNQIQSQPCSQGQYILWPLRHLERLFIPQTNHKFPHEGPSLEFCYMKHPRFGDIRCLKTLRNIQKGEEMFEDYNYGDDVSDESESPRWYKNQLKEIQAKNGEVGMCS